VAAEHLGVTLSHIPGQRPHEELDVDLRVIGRRFPCKGGPFGCGCVGHGNRPVLVAVPVVALGSEPRLNLADGALEHVIAAREIAPPGLILGVPVDGPDVRLPEQFGGVGPVPLAGGIATDRLGGDPGQLVIWERAVEGQDHGPPWPFTL
jgi:hypothetical protein